MPRRRAGFTMVELLSALAVIAVVTTIGLPALRSFVQDSRLSTATNALIGALNYGRQTALTEHRTITVCRSSHPNADDAGCDGQGGWESGWILFEDRDGDGSRDDDEMLLRRAPALPAGTTILGNTKVAARITFRPWGTTANNGSFALCDDRGWGRHARVVVIAVTGRARVASTSSRTLTLSNCTPGG